MIAATWSKWWAELVPWVDLRLLIWGGLSTVAVAGALVLLRRYARGKLVTQCVVWSILAHLILGTLLHDPHKRLPQGNSFDEADKGPPSIRVKLASEPQPVSSAQAAVMVPEPQPWDMVESPVEKAASMSPPPREEQDAAEIQVSKPSHAIAVPRIDPIASANPWKSTKPPESPAPRIARAPAAAQGLFMPSDIVASESTPLTPTPSSPKRLDIDEHLTQRDSPNFENHVRPDTQVAPNLAAEAPTPSVRLSSTESPRVIAHDQKLLLDEQGNPTSIMNLVKRPADPARADGEAIPDLLSLRVAPNRSDLAKQFGATDESERAIDLALAWLARNQSPDGRWDADRFGAGRETKFLEKDRQGAGANADSAMTGLALLAFLGNGQSHVSGDYAANIRKGLEYLKRIQAADGNLAGDAEYFARTYSHGMATIAIGEALAMSGDESLRPVLRRAASYTLSMQHPRHGGWRYASPQVKADDLGDMSQFGWQVMALKSASLSGLVTPDRSRQAMLQFMGSVSAGKHGGLAKYYPVPGERPTRTMTAEAACCRFFLGAAETEQQRNECTQFLLDQLPGEGAVDFYYWYYGTLALFQRQGEPWKAWNSALQEQLLDRQSAAGEFAGSWDADKTWGSYGGRVYSTALATLCLEVYYRYLPVYQLSGDPLAADAVPGHR
jgi:hypothetical protein